MGMRNTQNNMQSGFSLIETAMVILILSFVITPLFALLSQQKKQKEVLEREAVNERVLAGLSLYLRQNGAYPCPALPTLAPGETDFGAQDCSGVTSTAGVSGGQVLIGAIPVRDLNLPFRTAANQKNWKYIYAVTENLTAPGTYDGVGRIRIIDEAGAQFTANDVHFVVVDPGYDAKGSYALGGTIGTACGTVALDDENCDEDSTFREANFAQPNNPTVAAHYDDTISYTLAREESTMWLVKESAGAGGGLDIANRNVGNVGIGTDAPSEKMHVSGGDVRVEGDGTSGGNVIVEKNITADENITATKDVQAQERVIAPTFYYSSP
jgi:type II secretory pathway pseudopilin PulG